MDTVDRIFGLLDKMPIEQQEFAKLVGVSDDTASNWRRRKSASYSKYLSKIAEALGTTVEYLLTGNEKKARPRSEKRGRAGKCDYPGPRRKGRQADVHQGADGGAAQGA